MSILDYPDVSKVISKIHHCGEEQSFTWPEVMVLRSPQGNTPEVLGYSVKCRVCGETFRVDALIPGELAEWLLVNRELNFGIKGESRLFRTTVVCSNPGCLRPTTLGSDHLTIVSDLDSSGHGNLNIGAKCPILTCGNVTLVEDVPNRVWQDVSFEYARKLQSSWIYYICPTFPWETEKTICVGNELSPKIIGEETRYFIRCRVPGCDEEHDMTNKLSRELLGFLRWQEKCLREFEEKQHG